MKKLWILLLVFSLILPILAGCSDSQSDGTPNSGTSQVPALPEGMNGTEAAKLLLAEQRLSAHLINTEDNIFEDGVQTYQTLAQKAQESLDALKMQSDVSYSVPEFMTGGIDAPTSGTSLFGDVYSGEGVTYEQIDAFCRSYEMFAESVEQIVYNAQAGAEMIDYVKKHVRVVDTWIQIMGSEMEVYLHVEDNSETIFQRNEHYVRICHRYKNEKGQNVYELYEKRTEICTRSYYISGEKYVMSRSMEDGRLYDTLVAENSKGYWEVFSDTSTYQWAEQGDRHSPALFVMKDNICYGISYDSRDGSGLAIALATSDRTSDILRANYSSGDRGIYQFELNMGAFLGLGSAIVYEGNLAKLVLENGMVLAIEDAYKDGVLLEGGYDVLSGTPDVVLTHIVSGVSAWGVEALMTAFVYADSKENAERSLREYLEIWGLTPEFIGLDEIFADLSLGYVEAEVIIAHRKWNGYGIVGTENLKCALEAEVALFEEMGARYEAVKDAQVIDIEDRGSYELLVQFSKLSEVNAQGVQVEGMQVRLSDLTLATDDTLLLVEGEPYAVFVAFRDTENGELIHQAVENLPSVSYDGGAILRVSTGEIAFDIPFLTAGEFTLVAYLATADGIRVSEPTELRVESVVTEPIKGEKLIYSATKAEDGSLHILFEENGDVLISICAEESINDYQLFYAMLADEVYPYGMPGAVIEVLGEDGRYTALTGEETEFPGGEYRMGFTISNGETVTTGYAMITFEVEEDTAE